MSLKRRIASWTELHKNGQRNARMGDFRVQNEDEIDPRTLFKRSSVTLLQAGNDLTLNVDDPGVVAGAKHFLKFMYEAWCAGKLCDVILRVENGEELAAHKVALAAYSDSLVEEFDKFPRNEVIAFDLGDFSKAVVVDFLYFVYTTKIAIGSHNIRELLTLATELEVTILVEMCVNDLSNFSAENAIFYYFIIEDIDLPDLRAKIYHFICENFVDIVQGEDFLSITYDQLYSLVTDPNIRMESELDLFLAIVRWIDFDRTERLATAPILMQCVEFYKISPEVLVTRVEVEAHIFDMIECHMMLYEAMKWHALSLSGSETTKRFTTSAKATGGRVYNNQSSGFLTKKSRGQNSRTFQTSQNATSRATTERSGFSSSGISAKSKMGTGSYGQSQWFGSYGSGLRGASRDRNQSYVGGTTTEYTTMTGTSASETEDPTHDTGGRYMVQKNVFLPANQPTLQTRTLTVPLAGTPPPTSSPQRFTFPSPGAHQSTSIDYPEDLTTGMSTSVESMLKPHDPALSTIKPICVGGIDVHSHDAEKPGKCVYQYDLEGNAWSLVAKMPSFRHHHGVVVVAGKLCILGGALYNKKEPEKLGTATGELLVYDRDINHWSEATPLQHKRAYSGIVAYGSKIYAVGGEDESKTKLASVEVYDASFDSWKFLQSLRGGPKIGIAVCVYRNCLWVVGGYNPDRPDGPLLKDVECYDFSLQRWIPKTPLHIPVCHANLAVCMGKMYLVGGRTQQPEDGALVSLKSIHEYDDMNEKWRHASDLSVARHDAATSVVGTRMYIMGGMQTHRNICLDSVECFDTRTYTWLHNVANLPQPAAGLASCTM